MTLRMASLVGGRLVLGSIRSRARPCVDTPDETIDGFPEFTVTVDTIKDPLAKQKLRALARRIVSSHNTPNRIIGFEVHGHADVALNIVASERATTEFEVSRDRAENARDLLLKMIEEEGGKPIIAGIRANAGSVGVGSKCRKVKPAITEADRQKNRRVEIFLKVFHQEPSKPEPERPPAPPRPAETGSHWRLQIESGSIIAGNSPVGDILGFARIKLNLLITDIDRKQQARFVATGSGLAVGGTSVPSPLPLGGSFTPIKAGSPVEFTTTSGVTLNGFAGELFLAQNPGVAASVKSKGGKYALGFTALQPAFTRPGTIETAGGDDALAPPQVNVIIVTVDGTLEMRGTPTPVP